MSVASGTTPAGVARSVARHSLGWLVAANLVGMWLALVLIWPAVGDLIAPLTYGRWMPLHTDWQLYGWMSLPVVGVMLRWFAGARLLEGERSARAALAGWTLALVLGGLSWLGGVVSGKLFLEWSGLARPLLPSAMLVLWAVLFRFLWEGWNDWAPRERFARAALLVLLLPVPQVLFWSAGREIYPAVNPDSGGATGAALLGSTLGIVTIFLLLPALLQVPAIRRAAAASAPTAPDDPGAPLGVPAHRAVLRQSAAELRRWGVGGETAVLRRFGWGALAVSWGVFAAVDHGHTSHHALSQVVALAALLPWIPLLGFFWLGHQWSAAARPWVWAALAWWALLVASGWISFLPDFSETMKFTHGLVGHAHLAMAGVVTSVNGMMLTTLAGRAAPKGVFWRWQAGCTLAVVAMVVLGAFELERAGDLFRSAGWTQGLLALRLLGGLLMLDASARWLLDFWRKHD